MWNVYRNTHSGSNIITKFRYEFTNVSHIIILLIDDIDTLDEAIELAGYGAEIFEDYIELYVEIYGTLYTYYDKYNEIQRQGNEVMMASEFKKLYGDATWPIIAIKGMMPVGNKFVSAN